MVRILKTLLMLEKTVLVMTKLALKRWWWLYHKGNNENAIGEFDTVFGDGGHDGDDDDDDDGGGGGGGDNGGCGHDCSDDCGDDVGGGQLRRLIL